MPGKEWKDTDGNVINAHGGGIIFHKGKYYWYGEHRPSSGFTTQVGVTCYSSADLRNWKYEGVALAVSDEVGSDIEKGNGLSGFLLILHIFQIFHFLGKQAFGQLLFSCKNTI